MSLRDPDNHSEVVRNYSDTFQAVHWECSLNVGPIYSISLDNLDSDLKEILVVRIDDLDLSVRTKRALGSYGYEYIGDVVCLTEPQLLRLPNFGRRSLKELRETLKHLGLQMGGSIRGWNHKTADELRRELEDEIRESWTIDFQPQCGSGQQTLEDELIAIAKVVASKRNVEIITKIWGWSGNGRRTLESVSQEYGITRERVRQIVAKAERKLTKLPLSCPKLKEALTYLVAQAPACEDMLADGLTSAGITAAPFKVDGILSAAKILNADCHVVQAKVKKIPLLILKNSRVVNKILPFLRLVRRLSQANGCVNSDDLMDRLEVEGDRGRRCFSEIVNLYADFEWLDQEKKWLWDVSSAERGRNRIINVIRKIFSVTPSLHITELRQGLGRCHRIAFAPPSRVLLEICRRLDFLEVNGNQVSTISGRRLPSTLVGIESTLIKAFQGKSILSREALETNALALGMNRSSFYVLIGYSPIVARLDKGVYTTIGADIPPGAVEATKPSFKRKRVVVDFGWNASMYLWIAYRLSKSVLRGCQVGVPTSAKEFLQGEWPMETTGQGKVAVISINGTIVSGLHTLLERRGAECGDTIILVFDTKDHLFRMELGSDELVERWQNNELKLTDDQLMDS